MRSSDDARVCELHQRGYRFSGREPVCGWRLDSSRILEREGTSRHSSPPRWFGGAL